MSKMPRAVHFARRRFWADSWSGCGAAGFRRGMSREYRWGTALTFQL